MMDFFSFPLGKAPTQKQVQVMNLVKNHRLRKLIDAVGCAAIIGQSEYSAKLSNSASSYTAELIAILLVIKECFISTFW